MVVSPTDRRDPDRLARHRALVSAIRAGDRSAWGELYDEVAPEIFRRVLMPRLAHRPSAEDALAETFRTAIERLDQYEDQGQGIYPWLCRIAHNKAMDLHRARRVSGKKIADLTKLLEPLSEPILGADELLEFKSEAKAVRHRIEVTLDELTPRYSEVIRLRYFEQCSREDCARRLDVKLGTFDVVLHRALAAFARSYRRRAEERPPNEEETP